MTTDTLQEYSQHIVHSESGLVELNFDVDSLVKRPAVSVCVQTYQHGKYIRECLDSLVSQNVDGGYEILVGEDLSKDNTREICIEYARKYPHLIRLILHDRSNQVSINGVITGRYNLMTNLRLSRGRYIAICEGDDAWNDDTKLHRQVEFLENHPEFSICFHDAEIVDSEGKVTGTLLRKEHCSDKTPRQLVAYAKLPTASICMRRIVADSLPGQFRESLNGDVFMFRFAANFGGAGYLNINPSLRRIHEGGMWTTQKMEAQLLNNLDTLKKVAVVLNKEIADVAGRKISGLSLKIAIRQIRQGRVVSAIKLISQNTIYLTRQFGFKSLICGFGGLYDLLASIGRKDWRG